MSHYSEQREKHDQVLYASKAATAKLQKPKGSGRRIVELVQEDLEARSKEGLRKYGEPLKANNGRNALIDAYQEVLDLACYLRQRLEEELIASAEARRE